MTQSQTQTAATTTTEARPTTGKAKATKTDALLKLLRSKRGASIDRLQNASGWQSHSVRGFLSGTVKKKLGLTLVAESGEDGLRRYRIEKDAAGK